MIKLFIGEDEYTDYLATGFSFIERLDEQLDEGSIKLFATNKEMSFTPMSHVEIHHDDELIKAFLLSDDNVTVVSKNPIRYNHDITLVEVTKKLERFMVDGKTFTQPINEDSGYDPYTLYDVVQILRDITPLRSSVEFDNDGEPSDKLVFKIPQETKDVLDEVEAPEMNFKEQTLRECLDEVASYIDANVYLDEDEGLRLNFFNERKDEIDKDFIERTLNRDVEYYSTNMETNVMNAVSNQERGEVNVEAYPSLNSYTTSRSDSSVWDYPNSFFPTQNPIYDVKSVNFGARIIVREESYDGQWVTGSQVDTYVGNMPVERYIVERSKAETLDVADGVQEIKDNPDKLFANSVLIYEYGKKNIYLPTVETFFNEYESISHMLIQSLEYMTLGGYFDVLDELSIESTEIVDETSVRVIYNDGEDAYLFTISSPENDNIENNEVPVNVEYTSVKRTVRTNVEVSGVSETPYKSVLTGNQQMRIVDVPKFADKTQALVDRLGLSDLIMVDRIKDFGDALDLGDITTDGFILTQREFIIFKDFIRVMYQFNKDFNKRNQYAGIDSEIRQWEIGEAGRTVERNAIFDEYIELNGQSKDAPPENGINNSVTMFGDTTSKILTTFDINPTDPNYYKPIRQALIRSKQEITIEDQNYFLPYLLVPFTPYAGGNQINFHFNIDDNGSLGYHIERLVRWFGKESFNGSWFFDEVARHEQMPTLYVDNDGRVESLEFAFSDYDPEEDGRMIDFQNMLDQGDANPVAIPFETENGEKELIDFSQMEGTLRLHKDNRETLSLSLIYHFVSRDEDVMVGHGLPRRNKLISLENNDDLRVFFFNHKLGKRHKRKLPTDAVIDYEADISINHDEYYIDLENEVPLYVESYAIASEDGLPFILVNNVDKTRITFDFQRNRSDVTYDYTRPPEEKIIVREFMEASEQTHEFDLFGLVSSQPSIDLRGEKHNIEFNVTGEVNGAQSGYFVESTGQTYEFGIDAELSVTNNPDLEADSSTYTFGSDGDTRWVFGDGSGDTFTNLPDLESNMYPPYGWDQIFALYPILFNPGSQDYSELNNIVIDPDTYLMIISQAGWGNNEYDSYENYSFELDWSEDEQTQDDVVISSDESGGLNVITVYAQIYEDGEYRRSTYGDLYYRENGGEYKFQRYAIIYDDSKYDATEDGVLLNDEGSEYTYKMEAKIAYKSNNELTAESQSHEWQITAEVEAESTTKEPDPDTSVYDLEITGDINYAE